MVMVEIILKCEAWKCFNYFAEWDCFPDGTVAKIGMPMQRCKRPGLDSCIRKITAVMANHCNILAWQISWTEESGDLQYIGSPNCQTQLSKHTHVFIQNNKHDDLWNRDNYSGLNIFAIVLNYVQLNHFNSLLCINGYTVTSFFPEVPLFTFANIRPEDGR